MQSVCFRAVWGKGCCGDPFSVAYHDARVLVRVLGYERRAALRGEEDPAPFAERIQAARAELTRARRGHPELEAVFGSSVVRWRSRLDRLQQVAEEAASRRGKVSWA